MSMWLQPSPRPGTARLCSGKDGETIWLTEGRSVTYAQEQENRGLLIKVTAVLSLSDLMGGDTATVLGFREPSLAPLSSRRPKNGKTTA
jgi:hypothetical protein